MNLLALSAATAIAAAVSFGANAADLAYPPPPQYSVAPRPAVAPPQVIIVPGPTAAPQYDYGASAPPPVVVPSPYGVAPPLAPRVDVAPSAACPPIWRCGYRGCGWHASCGPLPDYSGTYGSPGPQVYPNPAPGPYPQPYAPQVELGPAGPYSDDRSVYPPVAGQWWSY